MSSTKLGIVVGLRRHRDAIRILGSILGVLLLVSVVAAAEEVRQTEFANELLGSWAPTNALCQANDEAKITISQIMYHGPNRTCGVLWIVNRQRRTRQITPSMDCALTHPNYPKLTYLTCSSG